MEASCDYSLSVFYCHESFSLGAKNFTDFEIFELSLEGADEFLQINFNISDRTKSMQNANRKGTKNFAEKWNK